MKHYKLFLLLMANQLVFGQSVTPFIEGRLGVNNTKVVNVNGGGSPASELYDPGLSYSFGGGLSMRLYREWRLNARFMHEAIGFVNTDTDPIFYGYARVRSNTLGGGIQYKFRNITIEPMVDYAIANVHKSPFYYPPDPEPDYTPDFWLGSIRIGYQYKFIEPYLVMTRGITPYHKFPLPGSGPAVRHLYVREWSCGLKLSLLSEKVHKVKKKRKK
jgi:hypothetical protein